MAVVGFYSQKLINNLKNDELYGVLHDIFSRLAQNDNLRFTFYMPGSSYDIIYQYDNALFSNIRLLVKQEKLDLVSGSYYQSMLSFLPNKYKSSHIEATTAYIKRNFKKKVDTVMLHDNVFASSYLTSLVSCSAKNLIISTYNKQNNKTLEYYPFVMKELNSSINVYPTNDTFDIALRELLNNQAKIKDVIQSIKDAKNKITMINLDLVIECNKRYDFDYLSIILDSIETLKTKFIGDSKPPTKRSFLGGGYYGYNNGKEKFFQSYYIKHENLRRLYDKTQYYFALESVIKRDKIQKNKIIEQLSFASNAMIYTPSYDFNNYNLALRQYNASFLCAAEKSIMTFSGKTYAEHCFDNQIEHFYLSKFISCSFVTKGGSMKSFSYIPTGINYVDVLKAGKNNSSIERAFTEKLFFDDKTINLKNKEFEIHSLKKKAHEINFFLLLVENNLIIEKQYDINHNNVALTYKFTNSNDTPISFKLNSSLPLACGDSNMITLSVSNKDQNDDEVEVNQLNLVNAENISIYDKSNKTNLRLITSSKTNIKLTHRRLDLNLNDIRYLGTYISVVEKINIPAHSTKSFILNLRIERKKN